MKKSLLAEVAERVRLKNEDDPHLSLDELRNAVFEDECSERTTSHLNDCTLCRNLVAREQDRNPLYFLMKQAELDGTPREEFWAEMDRVLKEIMESED